jgi:hypothetical protein
MPALLICYPASFPSIFSPPRRYAMAGLKAPLTRLPDTVLEPISRHQSLGLLVVPVPTSCSSHRILFPLTGQLRNSLAQTTVKIQLTLTLQFVILLRRFFTAPESSGFNADRPSLMTQKEMDEASEAWEWIPSDTV